MSRFSSLRIRLAAVIFVAVAPALGLMFYTNRLWLGLLAGVLAVAAAWFSGGQFIMRQIRTLTKAADRLAAGDLTARTGLANEQGELGQIARSIDRMAESLERQVKEHEGADRTLLNRAHQQTVVAALGQFALETTDFNELLNQAVNFVAQTLEVEYCDVLELLPDGKALLLRAGVGWKDGYIGRATVDAEPGSQVGYAFVSGEPVVVTDLRIEKRFRGPKLLIEHGVVSGVNVVITGGTFPFGVLGAHTTRERNFTEDEIHFLIAVATVLAMAVERKRNENELQKLASFAQLNPNPVLEFSADGKLTYFNEAATKMANLLGQEHPQAVLPSELDQIIQSCLATGQSKLRFETRPAGRVLSWSFFPITASRAVHCYVEDITDRLNLEAQLRQSQKMESVGQLAAGVAHDFNNMLTIIQGHAGIIMARPSLPPEMFDSVQAVYFAAERAAGLTRQLLMFSRKNVMQPKFLDLKEVVANMTKMLQRLLGETIRLEFHHASQLPAVQGDTGMIEQVIMNLAVNARDAMLKGGTLTISTTPVEIGDSYIVLHPESRRGPFVCVRVSDTGCGMDATTQARIFEPFFTTKEVGKGTGLGLATVYGIVKQHEGWIEVASQVGQGTIFNVFFPASGKPAEASASHPKAEKDVRGGKETILIVEDEPILRDLAHLILKECGYHIFEAGDGVEALTVWQKHGSAIDLLLTDMVMPEGISGKELAEKLVATKPGLKVIFTTGYSVEEVNRDGFGFLQKPYNRLTLTKAVRDCLDAN